MDITVDFIPDAIPRQRTKRVADTPTRRIIERYKSAYKAAYGVVPEVKVEGKWLSVQWKKDRVTRKRLKEMTRQLEYRNG